jgi:hypothetical protein
VVTFSGTVTQFGLTASRNGTQYITAWDSNADIIGQVKWVPGNTSGFVGIDTKGIPIAMLSYGNDDVMGGTAYSIGGSTIMNDTWLWGRGTCDAGTASVTGNVTALTSTAALANIGGEADFDEGPTSGAIPLTQYTGQGMTFGAGTLSSILSGVSEMGAAIAPEYSTAGSFPTPACGQAVVKDQHASYAAVATFSGTVTQVGLTISTESTRYITAWDSSGSMIGQLKWVPNGSAAAFIGISSGSTPIAMIALGDDDVWGGDSYDPAADVYSDSWVWAAGCNNNNDCIDTNKCNGDEICVTGSCQPQAAPPTCSDMNGCTDDACNTQTGCSYVNNNAPCSDGDACTTGDICGGGSCAGMAKSCDDSNGCTDDSCDSMTGCIHASNTASCDDDDACTDQDICADSLCGGTAITCHDAEVCTNDSCDPLSGCVFDNNTDPCDDADACTDQDTCADGLCSGAVLSCDDDDICTANSCDMLSGCGHAPIDGCCTSDAQCAADESCNLERNECARNETSSSSSSGGGIIDDGPNGVAAESVSCSCHVVGSPTSPAPRSLAWLLLLAAGAGRRWRRANRRIK